jgi:hypothetical protein
MVVLVAAELGVTVGAIVFVGFGVFLGVPDAVDVGVKEGVAGAPFWICIAASEKPGALVAVGVPLLPPPQLRRIAPKTKNTTGVTTSHLSHRDNIKPWAMTMAARDVKLMRVSRAKFASWSHRARMHYPIFDDAERWPKASRHSLKRKAEMQFTEKKNRGHLKRRETSRHSSQRKS